MSSNNQEIRSFILSLREEGRINENALNVISDLTLEELIAVKLESSSKALNGKMYNFPIWYSLPNICKDACLRFARANCKTKSDMASLLGVPYEHFIDLYKKYFKDY